MMAEPEWLAAEPSDRAKLTAIVAALRRCYAECPGSGAPATGPHMTTTMAELFIGQMMITADERIRASEREQIRPLVAEWRADAKRMEHSHPSACANFRDAANDLEQRLDGTR